MTQSKLVLLCLATVLLGACAIYDPQRGVFVSSSIQTVPVSLKSRSQTAINLLPFNPPERLLTYEQTHFAPVGAAFIPISFEYSFDDVDQANLRASILSSLKDSGAGPINDIAPDASSPELNGLTIGISLRQAGITSNALTTTCILDTEVYISSPGGAMRTPVHIEGTSAFSVAGAKNDAISQFVKHLAGMLAKP